MYYLTADGGGTKLIVILYDETFRVVSEGRAGGTNENFRSREDIRADMRKALRDCLGTGRPSLEAADALIVGPSDVFEEELRACADVKEYNRLHEGEAALLAGNGERYGLLALAGTGASNFLLQPGFRATVGGWGSVLGDEGGGFDVGTRTLRAAIYAEDGRGEDTLILPLLKEEWKLHELWDMVRPVYHSPDQRSLVASAARIAAKAAAAGDQIALSIYRDAAREIFRASDAVLRKYKGPFVGCAVTSGGVWKGSPVMTEEYRRLMGERWPAIPVRTPALDPCAGGAVYRAVMRGVPREEYWPAVKEGFRAYRY
ncbi:MAG: hypothetical protein J5849_04080 [Clostridia bacterium]|nr:hypothetical protein [Clostridia bacterium]